MKRIFIAALVVLSFAFLLTSCAGVAVSGRNTRYHYWYYPTAGTYFDFEQKYYYYPEKGGWKRARHLPSKFSTDPTHVVVEGDQDRPYTHFEEHRRKYPGQRSDNSLRYEHQDDRNDGRARDVDDR